MTESSNLLIYQTQDGSTKIQVQLTDNSVWLSQANMVELFQSSKSNISEHIKHIFEEGELQEDSVVRKFRTTAADGKSYATHYYNLLKFRSKLSYHFVRRFNAYKMNFKPFFHLFISFSIRLTSDTSQLDLYHRNMQITKFQ